MPVFPEPAANRLCKCADAREAAACVMGHATECHYPFDCPTAGCGHLWQTHTRAEIAELETKALETIRKDGRYTVYSGGDFARVKEGLTPEELEGPFSYA